MSFIQIGMSLHKTPSTTLGKWSVELNALFVLAVAVSVVLVKVLGLLSFGDRWWDVTVGIVFPASLVGAILGIVAVARGRERAVLVRASIFVGACTFLFILTHSLFIND